VLSPHTAWGLVASRTGSPVVYGVCLTSLCSGRSGQPQHFEAILGSQAPYRCSDHRLVGPRNRTAAKSLVVSAFAIPRILHLSANSPECPPKKSFAYGVQGRAWQVLATPRIMNGMVARAERHSA
jgi:hypothetical protein